MFELPKYEGEKFENGSFSRVDDYLTIEEALQININQEPFTVIMRSPGYEEDMVRGLLHNEDIFKGNKPLKFNNINKNKLDYITALNVDIPSNLLGNGYLNSRSLLSVSSCGICGKRELGDLSIKGDKLSGYSFSPDIIDRLLDKMKNQQMSFAQSGGSHAAAAFDENGKLLIIREDIGRHNAVDKVIGGLINKNLLDRSKFLAVSGRISYEIVTKTFMAKIPVLLAVSAPSSLSVDFAKELGVSVFGFCRDKKATRYS
jgi:FdhD protein